MSSDTLVEQANLVNTNKASSLQHAVVGAKLQCLGQALRPFHVAVLADGKLMWSSWTSCHFLQHYTVVKAAAGHLYVGTRAKT